MAIFQSPTVASWQNFSHQQWPSGNILVTNSGLMAIFQSPTVASWQYFNHQQWPRGNIPEIVNLFITEINKN